VQDFFRDLPFCAVLEECAETPEPHIFECMVHKPHLQHVLQVGDPLQLQPSVDCYDVQCGTNFDMSCMERLMNNGFPSVRLRYQRRMIPDISRCV